MSASVKWAGLEELRAELRRLPADLTGEAARILEGTANGATVSVRTAYGAHRVTGHLQASVEVERLNTGPFGAAFRVKATDAIAWLFDNGSQARHWLSGKSTGAMWGKTPPTHTFVRTMDRARRAMYDELKAMLRRHGLEVSGDA